MNNHLIHFDSISLITISLVIFIAINVAFFAKSYLKGDNNYYVFFSNLLLLVSSLSIMLISDNIFLFLIAWFASNSILIVMMIHKSSWKSALASGVLTAKTMLFGFICLIIALLILRYESGDNHITIITTTTPTSPLVITALVLIVVAAMTQSAIWPFHKWLISSLNSPTPVSAMMHAGLVNGGGILLSRFSHLYLNYPKILLIIFMVGVFSAILGTAWKLMQSNVKGMLASSTMSQMGFMMAQCGLGLFGAAIAHLVLHGMFKAYLFLSSASVWQEKRVDLGYPPKPLSFLTALMLGIFGSYVFSIASHHQFFVNDSSAVLMAIIFIASAQLALNLIDQRITLTNLISAIIVVTIASGTYGFIVHGSELVLQSSDISYPQELNIVHIIGTALLSLAWLCRLFFRGSQRNNPKFHELYVKTLNASQPHPSTVTSARNNYKI